jgi:hypothetical protein
MKEPGRNRPGRFLREIDWGALNTTCGQRRPLAVADGGRPGEADALASSWCCFSEGCCRPFHWWLEVAV